MHSKFLSCFSLILSCCLLPAVSDAQTKNVLMIAGPPSHGFGSHEHYAGLKVLEESILASTDTVTVTVVRGWPQDKGLIDAADSIVIYCDGGKRHVAMDHRDELKAKLADGCGLVCIHYAVEMVPGESGDDWVEMLGGHFEIDWSVNPHWIGEFKTLPQHPICGGVKPFEAYDEWYFHMRFKEGGKITPILAAVAPEHTMRRPDGAHSGNPAVRKSVAAGEKQTVAWAYDRADGGRSFGFTGGHNHWNWGSDDMRRLVCNAIRWTAGDALQPGGSSMGVKRYGIDELLENQDYDLPAKFDRQKTVKEFDLQSSVPLPRRGGPQTLTAAKDIPPADQRAPEAAIAGLEIGDGLEATLAASEPELRSLTNLDIDDRGRVWVCDVMNYRRNQGSRPEGDRILILEDTTGDGVMDSVKTFYQGRDIDSAMGICVLGNQVIVTASPYVWRFTDEDGDDVPDRQEAFFTETGQPQHDHSGHSFLFGPDGKLYWNVGNTGGQVKDAEGNTVVDIHGRAVVDNGQPFYGGMPFRCDPDGSNFEVLAHNFRNNWETTVDSFGTLWQSDNDDDGNRGTRINFVMEHGNYGYRDELTGAGWRDDRITLEQEIPLRHWHLNDPGVVPNMLQTGAGSPSGICFYEGRLLPQRFWDQIIHCDPGPNVVRAYPTTPDGAGYSAKIDPLMSGTIDTWFRPADVCVAPDGSLFVTDWYDPGVGGHHQGDTDRGRLFRIAPPGTPYKIPQFDYTTVSGAIDALCNPNLAVRYKAWTALHAMGREAESSLQQLFRDSNPRLRARALWLLGKIEGRGRHYVELALSDPDPNIRITAIRLARQLGLTPSVACRAAANDSSPAVRRELAVALRYDDSSTMPGVWAQLAAAYDGKDRWYLEALGLSSDLRAAECYDAWLAAGGDVNDAAGSDIAWRVRSPTAATAIAAIIADPLLELAETNRYFRSLEYHDPAIRTAALRPLLDLAAGDAATRARNDAIIVRSIQRMQGFDPTTDDDVMLAVRRHIERSEGTAEYIKLLMQFRPDDVDEKLVKLLTGDASDSLKVEAAQMLGNMPEGPKRLRGLLFGESEPEATTVARILGLLGDGRAVSLLGDVAGDAQRPYAVRRNAVGGLAGNKNGEKKLLELASTRKLAGDTRLLAGGLLARSGDESVRKRAAELLPQPQQKDQQPLAPIDQLAGMKGDVENGVKLFRGVATCANCHIVDQHGKEVGPTLSEIGSKLSREAMFTSILDPSAGISHNFENYVVLTDSGQVINGLKMSETADAVLIRTAEAIDRNISKQEIETMKVSEQSIMPENLHHTIDQKGLVDIVEYMSTLKKPQ
jgi:putative membrane-bound dehydrogenase-like protein